MELSRKERWILSNQYRILEALYPEEAEHHKRAREVLDSGYALHYDWLIEQITDDPMSEEDCREVLDILSMFESLELAYDRLSDKSGIEEWRIRFGGFDGNNEGEQLGYAHFFCNQEGGRFKSLKKGIINSHAPTLQRYRKMLAKWEEVSDKHSPSKDDLIYMAYD